VTFPQREAFESFTRFIKTLENVSELELDIQNEQRNNQNNYSEILMHLLNVEVLTKLTLNCENIENAVSGLHIQNPTVESLTTNQPSFHRFFSNLQKLHIKSTLFEMNENITRIMICQNSLTEIQIDAISSQTLLLFKCPCLKKFSASRICYIHSGLIMWPL
jgi:hypothetical protein